MAFSIPEETLRSSFGSVTQGITMIQALISLVSLREDQQLVEKTWDGERVTPLGHKMEADISPNPQKT